MSEEKQWMNPRRKRIVERLKEQGMENARFVQSAAPSEGMSAEHGHEFTQCCSDVIVLQEQNRELREERDAQRKQLDSRDIIWDTLKKRIEVAEKRAERAEAALAEARNIIKQILSDLPRKRDWLDPDLEARAKLALREKR